MDESHALCFMQVTMLEEERFKSKYNEHFYCPQGRCQSDANNDCWNRVVSNVHLWLQW